MIRVHTRPLLSDNYCYILEADNGDIAVIDPGESAPVLNFLKQHHLHPNIILLTHHHGDHIDGAPDIKRHYDSPIIGPAAEFDKIPFLDQKISESDTLEFGGEAIKIISTPGHTLGHLVFHFSKSHLLFSGDTLFIMGCGRVFEGTMDQMHMSLQKLKALPPETQVYCGHEYTQTNAKFLHSIAPENHKIAARLNTLKKCNVPSTIKLELETNLFLQADSAVDFTRLRRIKDLS